MRISRRDYCCCVAKMTMASFVGVMTLLSISLSVFVSHLSDLAPLPFVEPVTQSTVSSSQTVANKESAATIPVFYNLFVRNSSDAARVEELVLEQLTFLQPEHRVFMHSIGYPIELPMIRLAHHDKGTEIDTLHSLWEYCTINPQAHVAYVHSKGSFNPIYRNKVLRRFMSAGALSKECSSELPDDCDVCSSRFSPLPHPHTSGNMWSARCSYIQRLIDPALFEARMDKVTTRRDVYPGCLGLARYSAEHWVYSHPSNRPCDLHLDRRFTWGYNRASGPEFVKSVAMAPRFPLETFVADQCVGIGLSGQDRIREYRDLYNETPSSTWWGWNYYNDTKQ